MNERFFTLACPCVNDGKKCGGVMTTYDDHIKAELLPMYPTRALAELAASDIGAMAGEQPDVVEVEMKRV